MSKKTDMKKVLIQNKKTILKTLLMLFAVLAMGLSTTVDSVKVFNTVTGDSMQGSYFSMLPVGSMQMLAPFAGLCCMAVLALALVVIIGKQEQLAVMIKWLSLVAACVAVLPIVARGEIVVIPNVGVPLFLLGEWIVSSLISKKEEPIPAKKKAKKK